LYATQASGTSRQFVARKIRRSFVVKLLCVAI
jgi:hypothetical protein